MVFRKHYRAILAVRREIAEASGSPTSCRTEARDPEMLQEFAHCATKRKLLASRPALYFALPLFYLANGDSATFTKNEPRGLTAITAKNH